MSESYIFGGSTGLSYEQLKRRREIALAMMKYRQRAPQNIGEGIYSAASDLSDAWVERGLRDQERQLAAQERDAAGRGPADTYAVGAEAADPTPDVPSPARTPPATITTSPPPTSTAARPVPYQRDPAVTSPPPGGPSLLSPTPEEDVPGRMTMPRGDAYSRTALFSPRPVEDLQQLPPISPVKPETSTVSAPETRDNITRLLAQQPDEARPGELPDAVPPPATPAQRIGQAFNAAYGQPTPATAQPPPPVTPPVPPQTMPQAPPPLPASRAPGPQPTPPELAPPPMPAAPVPQVPPSMSQQALQAPVPQAPQAPSQPIPQVPPSPVPPSPVPPSPVPPSPVPLARAMPQQAQDIAPEPAPQPLAPAGPSGPAGPPQAGAPGPRAGLRGPQLAALGGGATMSDAAPIGIPIPPQNAARNAVASTLAGPPPVQVAQAPPPVGAPQPPVGVPQPAGPQGGPPPQRGPGGFEARPVPTQVIRGLPTPQQQPPPPQGRQAVPGGGPRRDEYAPLPSRAPLPADIPQYMEPPGAEPRMPGRRAPSAAMVHWGHEMVNPARSPGFQAYAKRQYDMAAKNFEEVKSREMGEFTHRRARHEKYADEYRKWEVETPERDRKRALDFHNLEKLRNDIEKQEHERGPLRDYGLESARLGVEKAKQDLLRGAIDIVTIDGQPYARRIGTLTLEPVTGGPAKEIKMTEKQANALGAYRIMHIASDQIGNNDAALAGLVDTGAGYVPIGGNYLVSEKYQKGRSAARLWTQAKVRYDSGATIQDQELDRETDVYFPKPGDSPQRILEKRIRRMEGNKSVYDATGPGRQVADDFVRERSARKSDKPEGTEQKDPQTGKIRRVIDGHWEIIN